MDLSHVAYRLNDIAGTRFTLGTDHGSALCDTAKGFTEVTRTADEWHLELVLVDVVNIVSRREDFTFIDVVDLDGLEDLRFDKVTDAAFRHDRDGDGFLDALDHFRIAHAGYAARFADVGRDAFECHDGCSAGCFRDPCLLRCGDVHDDAAFQHLGEFFVQFIAFIVFHDRESFQNNGFKVNGFKVQGSGFRVRGCGGGFAAIYDAMPDSLRLAVLSYRHPERAETTYLRQPLPERVRTESKDLSAAEF